MDSNREITPEGRCEAWHVDFYSPQENAAYVMRIDGEKIKDRDKRPGKGLDYPSLEHVYACAGDFPGEVRLKPREFPKKWADSTVFAPKAMAYLREQVDSAKCDTLADSDFTSIQCRLRERDKRSTRIEPGRSLLDRPL